MNTFSLSVGNTKQVHIKKFHGQLSTLIGYWYTVLPPIV